MRMDTACSSLLGDVVSTIGELKLWNVVVDIQTRTADIEQYFLTDATAPGCVITSPDGVFGILSRKNFTAAISRPFGREVFMKRPVGELVQMIDVEPLVLDEGTSIAYALRLAMARSGEQCFEPLLVSRPDSVLGNTSASCSAARVVPFQVTGFSSRSLTNRSIFSSKSTS